MEKELDLYAAFYKAKKKMETLAKEDEIEHKKVYEELEKCFNDSRPVVAEQIYSMCDIINGILAMLPESLRVKNEIDVKNKPSIFLTGEFSGGKTTLIHQLAGHKSGSESGGPETASIVIHKCAKESNCEIFFENEFTIGKSFDFQKLLQKYDIRMSDFKVKGNSWSFMKTSIEKSDWKISEIQGFISEMSEFPNAIKKIIWTHSGCPSYSPLNFATLYDMPGIGGKDSHETIISKVFEGETPDIVCYVLDTDRGIPGAEAVNQIKEIATKCDKDNTLFFWLYAKPSTNKSQEIVGEFDKSEQYWLNQKRKELDGFIDSIHPQQLTDFQDLDVLPSIQLLKNAPIIDARNSFIHPTDNTAHTMNAFAIIVNQFYIRTLEKYVSVLGDYLAQFKVPEEFDVFVKQPIQDYPGKLRNIFDVLKSYSKIKSYKDTLVAFKHLLYFDNPDSEHTNFRTHCHLESLLSKINNLIEKQLSQYTSFSFGAKEIDLNKFHEYKNILSDATKPENRLYYDVQIYHWFKMFYNNQLIESFTHEYNSSLYFKLKAMLDKIKEYKTGIMYILQ